MILAWLGIGFAVGAIATFIAILATQRLESKYGKYLIDRRNPEKEVHKLDFGDPRDLSGKKYIVLEVDYNADLSRE